MSKKLIIAIFIGLIIIILGYSILFKKEESSFILADVLMGNISREVSTTGTVTPAKKIELQFKTSGEIKNILTEVGDKVTAGQQLVKLDSSDLYIKRDQASAALELANAKLNQLLAGKSKEEIEVYETAVKNAEKSVKDSEIALKNSKQNLTDVKASEESDLSQAFESALNTLNDAELKSYNAYVTVDLIQRTYFTTNDQAATSVKENKNAIKRYADIIEASSDIARQSFLNEDIDKALSDTNNSLKNINNSITIIREQIEKPLYKDTVSSANKTSLDTQRTNIITILSSVISDQQTITSTKITNQSNVNTAKTSVDTAKKNLNTAGGVFVKAKNELAVVKAGPRETDIALNQAEIKEAQANLSLAEKQISDTIMKAPANGIITKVNGEIGEKVEIGKTVIILITESKFQIEADIAEVDIGRVALTQPVEITLDAFPEHKFFGDVIEIEPAETVIQGVVYYKIKVGFDEQQNGAKPGMTANIVIITNSKENILIIPQRAVKEKDGIKYVRVPIDSSNFEEINIETGIRGSNGMMEIIFGLKEGDKVITSIKDK